MQQDELMINIIIGTKRDHHTGKGITRTAFGDTRPSDEFEIIEDAMEEQKLVNGKRKKRQKANGDHNETEECSFQTVHQTDS